MKIEDKVTKRIAKLKQEQDSGQTLHPDTHDDEIRFLRQLLREYKRIDKENA